MGVVTRWVTDTDDGHSQWYIERFRRMAAEGADHAAAAGLTLEHRFATWDLRPWQGDAPFAVTILRRPAEGASPPR